MSDIGILHPGEMGVSVAASAINSGHRVFWLSTGRSYKTRMRAEQQHLLELQSLTEFCRICKTIISVCPPHAAEEVARQVVEEGFRGTYLDANAISPQRAVRLNEMMDTSHIDFVDGSIIGGPTWTPGETWLYLAGKNAEAIVECFKNGPLETKVIGNEAGKASALKMCYAAYSKGTTALLAAILGAAESFGVRMELYRHWDMDDLSFSEQVNRRVTRTTAKAWRFEGEMEEIASTFQMAGLPDGFHKGAAEVFHRMANPSVRTENSVEEVIAAVLRGTT